MDDISVFDVEGQAVLVKTLWQKNPVLVSWLRHYG